MDGRRRAAPAAGVTCAAGRAILGRGGDGRNRLVAAGRPGRRVSRTGRKGVGVKTLTKELWMEAPRRRAIVSIHRDVERLVAESGVKEGLCLVNAMHITASVFINDDESGLHADYEAWLEGLAPFDASPQRYAHNRTGEENAGAHLTRQVMGREVVVAITDGKLHLGPWEHLFYYEFDGRRRKRVLVKIIGE